MAEYGNVPEDDVQAVREAVRIASSVADRLPPIAPAEWREIAYQTVLDGILRDWVANGTTELDQEDEEDLANLVRLAIDLALQQPAARQTPTFRTVCSNAMRDWVENWNDGEDEDDGF